MRFEEYKKYLPHAGVAAVAFGVGLGVGWWLSNRRGVTADEDNDNQEADVPGTQLELEFGREPENVADWAGPETADTPRIQEARPVESDLRDLAPVELEEGDDGDNLVSIFRNVEDDDWSYEAEAENRTGEAPYVIHRDEYFANEEDWSQCTVTYYAGDDVLCDTDDVPLYEYRKITGELLFGHGSLDPNIVYIRNPKIEVEYEVLRDPGFYTQEVLGAQIEHSFERRKPPIPRFIKE